jgi:hypothetical protein
MNKPSQSKRALLVTLMTGGPHKLRRQQEADRAHGDPCLGELLDHVTYIDLHSSFFLYT